MRIAFAILAAAILAGPARAKPEIKDVQAAHGQLGPEIKKLEYVRGDEVYFRFNVIGFTAGDDGRMVGEMGFVVTDAKGKEVVKRSVPVQQTLALGGGTFPAHVSVTLGEQLPVGEYTVKVTVTDNQAKESDSFERKFTCKAEEFALVAMRFSQDKEGHVPARIGGVVSQTLYFQARGVGFDKGTGVLDVEMTIEVFDDKGKPTMPKPIKSVVHNEDPNVVKGATLINLRGELALNRPGDFVLRVSLIDKVAKKTVKFEAPLKVERP